MENKGKASFTSLQEIGLETLLNRFQSRKGKQISTLEPRLSGRIRFRSSEATRQDQFFTQAWYADTIHFDLTYTPLPHLGSKWVTATMSRLLAAGSKPEGLMVSFAVPNKISVEMLDAILEGMDRHPANIPVDVTEVGPARSQLSVCIVGMGTEADTGWASSQPVVAGDALCVTGDVGGAMAGLRVLLREKRYWDPKKEESFTPDLSGYEHVVGKQLLPACRLDFVEGLLVSGVKPGGLLDLSQGLMNDLQLLAGQSNCGFKLFSPALPIDLTTRKVADEMKEDVDRYALYGGEDFEFLFTIPDEEVEKLRASFDDFTVIGEVTRKVNEIEVNDGERGSV